MTAPVIPVAALKLGETNMKVTGEISFFLNIDICDYMNVCSGRLSNFVCEDLLLKSLPLSCECLHLTYMIQCG